MQNNDANSPVIYIKTTSSLMIKILEIDKANPGKFQLVVELKPSGNTIFYTIFICGSCREKDIKSMANSIVRDYASITVSRMNELLNC